MCLLFFFSVYLCAQINETLAFRFPLKFLLLVDEVFGEKLVDVLSNYSILPSTDLMVVKEAPEDDDFELWQPYKIDMEHAISKCACIWLQLCKHHYLQSGKTTVRGMRPSAFIAT